MAWLRLLKLLFGRFVYDRSLRYLAPIKNKRKEEKKEKERNVDAASISLMISGTESTLIRGANVCARTRELSSSKRVNR